MKLREVATRLNISTTVLNRILNELEFKVTKSSSGRISISENEFMYIEQEYNKFEYVSSCGIRFKSKDSYRGHMIVCKTCNELDKPSSEKLNEFCERYKNGESIYSLSKEMNIVRLEYYIKELKRRNIKLRNASEAALSDKTREKYVNTCIEKFGHTNTFQSPKTAETFMKRYGVTNPDHIPGVVSKIINTKLEKYGGIWGNNYKPLNGISHSKIHDIVSKYLEEEGYEIINEFVGPFKVVSADGHVKYAKVDIFIPKFNLVIEINGGYWHADPRKYSRNDIIRTYEGRVTAEHIWAKDKARENFIKSFGVNFIVLWEREIRNGEYKEIITKCLKELNVCE